MEFDLIVFDFDGTLADTIPDIKNAVAYSAKEYGDFEIPDSVMRAHIAGGAPPLINGVFTDLGIKDFDTDKHVRIFTERYSQYNTIDTVLFDHALDVITELRAMGCIVTICTMKSSIFTNKMLKDMDLEKYFDGVMCDDMMERPKPDAWSIDHFARQFNVSKDRILVVGDGMTDMTMAKNAGVKAAAVRFGYGDPEMLKKNSDYLISSLTEVLDIVKGKKMDKVILHGDIDLYNVNKLKEQLNECSSKDILIDASDLQYIDSTGLGVLVSSLKKVQENDGKIRIVGLKPHIHKIFVLTSLDKIFDIEVAE